MTTYKRRRARSLAVAGAVVAALGVWVVAELALGLQLRSPAFARSGDSFEIGPATIALTALLLSLAGWALMAVLERFTVRAARIWLVIAVLALVASLSGPL